MMSKENQPPRVTRFAAAALLLASLLPAAAPPAPARQAKRAVVNPKTAAVREATAEVLRETSGIRKLAVLRPVQSGAQSRAEIEQMLVRNLDESSTPAEMNAAEAAMKKFGLLPADFRLRPFIIQLLTEQVAGYYEPRTREFYLADWIDLEGQKPVMAHELTHALQDQHFDLRRFEKWRKHDSDAELAAHALIEGDAMVTMMQYVMRSPARQLAMLKSMAAGGPGATELFDKAPRVLRESLIFPYNQGSVWAAQLYKRGGWELISQAYRDLPKSTEQILHPEKYFAREEPLPGDAARDISPALGKGWRMADHDVNGEWGYLLILGEHLASKEEAERAAAGWNGDRYALFLGPSPGEALITQRSHWDTLRDAQEFFEAYSNRTSRRYGTGPEAARADGQRLWRTAEGSVLVAREGKTVLVVEGVPRHVRPEKLLGLL